MRHFRTSSEASVTISLGHPKTLKLYNPKTLRLPLPITPRWSSSGHDKAMRGSEFAGRLDFNQYTREINVFDILLEVQSAQT